MAFTYLCSGFKSLFKEQGGFRIYNRQLLKGDVEREVIKSGWKKCCIREFGAGEQWSHLFTAPNWFLCVPQSCLQRQASIFSLPCKAYWKDKDIYSWLWLSPLQCAENWFKMQESKLWLVFLSAHIQNGLVVCALQPFGFSLNKMLENIN